MFMSNSLLTENVLAQRPYEDDMGFKILRCFGTAMDINRYFDLQTNFLVS